MRIEYYRQELEEIKWELEETDNIDSMAIDDLLQRFEQFDMELIFLTKLLKEALVDKGLSDEEREYVQKEIKFLCEEYLSNIIDEEKIEEAFREAYSVVL